MTDAIGVIQICERKVVIGMKIRRTFAIGRAPLF